MSTQRTPASKPKPRIAGAGPGDTVASVRRFNRFYTRRIGVLNEGLLRSPFSLTQLRVLYELAHLDEPTAAELCNALGIDPGYLSRMLRGFQKRGLVAKRRAETDSRQSFLRLTPAGRRVFATVDAIQNGEVAAMVEPLGSEEQRKLVSAMETIERLLGRPVASGEPYLLRPPQPGDFGWVVHRHGVLYAQEYGWKEEMEALVAEVVTNFIRHFDPARDRCWIAEREGEIVGSVFVVAKSSTVAQLRLLLVEPRARGLGIGKRLVDECMRFARQAGYRKMMLWTTAGLDAARHIYEQAGFQLVHEQPHRSWGPELVGQNWEMRF